MSLLSELLDGVKAQLKEFKTELPKPDTSALAAMTVERDALALKVAAFEKDAPVHAKLAEDFKAEQTKTAQLTADLAKKTDLAKSAFDAAVAEGVAKVSAERGIKPLPTAAADPATGAPAKPNLTGLARTIAAFKAQTADTRA